MILLLLFKVRRLRGFFVEVDGDGEAFPKGWVAGDSHFFEVRVCVSKVRFTGFGAVGDCCCSMEREICIRGEWRRLRSWYYGSCC